MSLYNRILLYFLGAGFGIGGLVMAYSAFHQGKPAAPVILAVFFLLGGSYLCFRSAAMLRLTIDEYTITLANGFSRKSILLDEIAGYRGGSQSAILLMRKDGGRALTIRDSFERRPEFREWLQERYANIDAQLAKEVTEEVLHDERYGLTEDERGIRLAKARKIMVYSILITPFFISWVVISPQPFKVLMPLLLAIPLVAVALTWYYKGIFRLYISKTKPYPTLILAVSFTEIAAIIAVLREYNIYLFDGRAWGLVLALSVVVMLVWAGVCRAAVIGEKNLFAVYAGMWLIAAMYSYPALMFSNCEYDHHKEDIMRVGVNGKHFSRGKTTTYFLEVSAWGRYTDGKNMQVPYSLYHSVRAGDSVNVYLHPGKWGIPWYVVMID